MDYLTQLDQYAKEGRLTADLTKMMRGFYKTYAEAAVANGAQLSSINLLMKRFLEYVIHELIEPSAFEPFHQCVRSPEDFYLFGLDFIRPLVILQDSKILHSKNLDKIEAQISHGDNVILLANHQTELDPQAISLLLEKEHPRLAEEMIFVAGHRVISDPMAIPFSKGRNLLCIYSKKYIEDNPALKQERLQHNQRTMNRMSQLLSEGSKCIYVAPSGGRDRPNRVGKLEVAEFDGQSIELFWLMAQKSGHPTHFYPLALSTYDLLPPPDNVKKKLGEPRHTKATPIHLAFGAEVDMDHFSGSDHLDKKQKRQARARYIWEQVCRDYDELDMKKNSTQRRSVTERRQRKEES